MTQEEANKKILEGWSKERLAEEWVREHIKYNELKSRIEEAIEFLNNINCIDFTALIKILEGKNE